MNFESVLIGGIENYLRRIKTIYGVIYIRILRKYNEAI
jgi:hypothetical protein